MCKALIRSCNRFCCKHFNQEFSELLTTESRHYFKWGYCSPTEECRLCAWTGFVDSLNSGVRNIGILIGHQTFDNESDPIDMWSWIMWWQQSHILERTLINGGIISSLSFFFCDRHGNSSWNLFCEKEERERERNELDRTLHVLSSTALVCLNPLWSNCRQYNDTLTFSQTYIPPLFISQNTFNV